MALNIPQSLVKLDANCGVFAVWMLLQHHGIQMNVDDIAELCQHDPDYGTFTIALAVALKKYGFNVTFYTDPDPNIDEDEHSIYSEAKQLNIPMTSALTYNQLQTEIDSGKMAIVSYDNLDGVGNQSLVFCIDENEICFFDSFEPMGAAVFEQQRQAEGICRQVVLIEDATVEPVFSSKHS